MYNTQASPVDLNYIHIKIVKLKLTRLHSKLSNYSTKYENAEVRKAGEDWGR